MGNEGSRSETTGDLLATAAVENDLRVGWRRAGAGDGTIGARDGHCAVTAAGGKVFVFGGVVENSALGPSESNDLFLFCPETESWNVVEATGDIPPPRSSAAMAAVGCNLFLFGGLSQGTGWMNSVFMFDTERNTWKELNVSGTCPSPRDKMTATAVGCRIYVFGGFGPVSASEEGNDSDEEEEGTEEGSEEDATDAAGDLEDAQKAAEFGWFDDLFVLDTVTLSWSHPMQLNKSGPTRRAAHSTCAVSDKLVIFGGKDPTARRNDLHVFNIESRKWITDLPLTGIPPAPRSFHAACAVGHRIVIFGGRGIDNEHFNDIHVLDTETWQWMKPAVDGEPPTPRGLSTATVVGDQVLVFGGSSDFASDTMQCLTYFAETYILKVDDLLRKKPVTAVSGVGSVEQITGEGDVLRTPSDQSTASS